ncbi:hypothetical protein AAGT10_14980 (plasmid) [Sulfolobus tengchongensis]|uniref:Uncharacterized protein n=1 Tax=Sulfolobus tengchongensis TaxID=207809 RepID=A0AAX4L4G5_9CREN
MLDLGLQNLFDLLLITAYLEHAAGSASRYRYKRKSQSEEYLADVKNNQKNIFYVLDRANKDLGGLAISKEFEEYLDYIESELAKDLSNA